MIKNVSLGEFSAKAHTMVGDVLEGDIIRVDCDEAGAFVMIEEPEYKVLRDALKIVLSAATSDEPTYAAMLAAAKKAGLASGE